jgi:hypothetical protein
LQPSEGSGLIFAILSLKIPYITPDRICWDSL